MKELTLLQAFIILLDTAINNRTHQDYGRVVELAKKYKALITGENIGELLSKFVPRESDEAFAQRIELTQAITPASCEKIITGFKKVPKLNTPVYVLDWSEGSDDEKKKKREEVNSKLNTFFGEDSLNDYMEERGINLSFQDPNSFIVTTFSKFDSNKGKASPRPEEISSEMAVMYEYFNNILLYLISKTEIDYKVTTGGETIWKKGSRFILYHIDSAITLTQIEPPSGSLEIEAKKILSEDSLAQGYMKDGETIVIGKELAFLVNIFNYKAGVVPLVRVGYKPDLETNSRTMVSPLHPALPFLMKSLERVSEYDLTNRLHVFPQKFVYAPYCIGEENVGCIGGKTIAGEICKVCEGVGYIIHKSSSDAVVLPLPKDTTKMVDLDKLSLYKSPPIELIKFQAEQIDELSKNIIGAIFNSEMFYEAQATKTATEINVSTENLYDTLQPFVKKYAKTLRFITKLVATFVDYGQGVIVVYHFPRDLKLKSSKELISDYQAAVTADAPDFVLAEISNDLASRMFEDNQDFLKKLRVRMKFDPFPGKTTNEVLSLLSSNDVRRREKILYQNFAVIFSNIERKEKDFYSFEEQKQLDTIDAEIALIEEELTQSSPGGANPIPAETLTNLVSDINENITTLDQAAQVLVDSFGLSIETAKKLLEDAISTPTE